MINKKKCEIEVENEGDILIEVLLGRLAPHLPFFAFAL